MPPELNIPEVQKDHWILNSNIQNSVYLNQFVVETFPSKRLSASSLCAAEVTVIQKNWRREEIFIFH